MQFTTPILQKCSKPVRIVDKVHGGYMFVPCGHCNNCRANYRNKWMQRLDIECSNSASVLFFTLTYDNSHAPVLEFGDDMILHSNRSSDDDIDCTLMSTDDYIRLLHSSPSLATSKFSFNPNKFTYVCKSDLQKFFKRLRRRLDYDRHSLLSDVPPASREFRYFVCSEYGPQTFRAHYHGLLFFSNKQVASAVEQFYLHDSWKLCDISNAPVSQVVSSAPLYVAKYVSCDSSCPDILKLPQTSTFYLSSRRPAIGSTCVDYCDLSDQIYDSHVVYDKVTVVKNFGINHVELPYPNCIFSRWFPKPLGFSSMDYNDLVSFYSSALRHYPNLVSFVNSKYKIGQNITDPLGVTTKYTYSFFLSNYSKSEFAFGIPQNRHCLNVFLSVHKLYNISVHDYVSTLLHLYTVRFSQSMRFLYDMQNYFVASGVDWKRIAYYCCPDLFLQFSGKWSIMRSNPDLLVYLDTMLSSFNVSVSDYYDVSGNLCDGVLNHTYDYINTSDFSSYCDFILHSSIEFDKTRNINHLNNLNSNCYESF